MTQSSHYISLGDIPYPNGTSPSCYKDDSLTHSQDVLQHWAGHKNTSKSLTVRGFSTKRSCPPLTALATGQSAGSISPAFTRLWLAWTVNPRMLWSIFCILFFFLPLALSTSVRVLRGSLGFTAGAGPQMLSCGAKHKPRFVQQLLAIIFTLFL